MIASRLLRRVLGLENLFFQSTRFVINSTQLFFAVPGAGVAEFCVDDDDFAYMKNKSGVPERAKHDMTQ